MRKFKTLCLGAGFLFAHQVVAATPALAAKSEKLSLNNLNKNFPVSNVFDLDPAKPPLKKGGLQELKWRELRGQWAMCRNLAEKLQPTAKELEPWVSRVRLDCALKAHDEKPDLNGLNKAFQAVKVANFRNGPWKDMLKSSWAKAGLILARADLKARPGPARDRAEELLKQQDVLDKDDRASALTVIGESLQAKDLEQSLFFYQQAFALNSDAELGSKIESLRKGALKPTPNDLVLFRIEERPGAEAEAEKEIETSISEGKRVDAARSMVLTLNRFPNGKSAKRNRDLLAQMALNAFDRGDDEEAQALRDVMKEADPSRLADWATLMHRRGDDRSALRLAEKALETERSSPVAANLLWIAGRASQFMGQNDKAMAYFDGLIHFHAATEEAGEAQFRLALIHLRQENYATAAKLLEKLLSQNRQRWDLNARYWRVRALEKSDKARFEIERDDLLRRYPFTYYGLKLRAEKSGGVLEFPQSDRSPLENGEASLWLVGAQKDSWNRFRRLSQEGWLLEAQAELASLPNPSDAWSLVQWSRLLAKAGQHGLSITLSNRALDMEESLRNPRYMDFAFPRTYDRFIQEESKKYSLDPVLVRSLIRQESAFGLKALSTSNAMGLMQLIPPTAQDVARELKMKITIPDDLYRPEVNVPMGSYYVSKMLRDFGGNVPLALAAYNAGPGRMKRWLKSRPDLQSLNGKVFESWNDEIWYDELPWTETSFYVKAILRNALIDRLIDQGRVTVQPAFWTDLRKEVSRKSNDEVKRR